MYTYLHQKNDVGKGCLNNDNARSYTMEAIVASTIKFDHPPLEDAPHTHHSHQHIMCTPPTPQ